MIEGITVAAMVKNEADRYLRSALEVWKSFAYEIVVLDDGSTDSTYDICHDAGAYTVRRSGNPAWGAEAPARAELWDLAVAAGTDWIFVLDADMIPGNDPEGLPVARGDAVAFRLYDLWGEGSSGLLYRSDGFWYGHVAPRVWMVRNPGKDFVPEWSARGIHCGHLPSNLPIRQILYAPESHSILHYGYLTPDHRRAKLQQYRAVSSQLSDFERAHAESIADTDPNLEPLLWSPKWQLRC